MAKRKRARPANGKRTTAKKVQQSENLPPPLPPALVKPEVDEEPWDNDGLTIRQRSFVDALVGAAGGNATKAAQMAGYRDDHRESLAATACEILRKPNVARAVGRAMARRGMTPEWGRERLFEVAGASMANFLSVDGAGEVSLDLEKAAAIGAFGQIKEYYEEGIDGGGDGGPKIIKRRIKLHDPAPALATIMKLYGLLIDRQEITGANGGAIEHSVTPKFDHDRFAELYRRRTGGGAVAGGGPAPPDRN